MVSEGVRKPRRIVALAPVALFAVAVLAVAVVSVDRLVEKGPGSLEDTAPAQTAA